MSCSIWDLGIATFVLDDVCIPDGVSRRVVYTTASGIMAPRVSYPTAVDTAVPFTLFSFCKHHHLYHSNRRFRELPTFSTGKRSKGVVVSLPCIHCFTLDS